MRGYVAQRLLLAFPTLLGVTVLVFAMIRLLPGDVVSLTLEDYGAYAKSADELRAKLGLDQPVHEQYLAWLGRIARGDLGRSLRDQSSITQNLLARLPVTLELGLLGLAVSLLISIPLGVYSAVKQDTPWDYVARSAAIGMLAVPGFWLATLAITLPALWFRWTPPLRYTPLWVDPGRNLSQMAIPALILGIGLSGGVMRLTRAQMLEVLRQDYVRTAAAKGLRPRAVVFRHALKNAVIPVVTLLGLQLTVLVSGTVVLESIFVIPGMGRYLLEGVTYRDYPVVQAVMLVFAALIILSNLVVDLLYAWLDPRIRYGSSD
jgi:peptide/nickel transport system permease protein